MSADLALLLNELARARHIGRSEAFLEVAQLKHRAPSASAKTLAELALQRAQEEIDAAQALAPLPHDSSRRSTGGA